VMSEHLGRLLDDAGLPFRELEPIVS
jgi:hypothetical protein